MTAIDVKLAGKRFTGPAGYLDLIEDEEGSVSAYKASDVRKIYPSLVEETRTDVIVKEKLQPETVTKTAFVSYYKRMVSSSYRHLDRAVAEYVVSAKFASVLAHLPKALPPLNEEVRVLLGNIDKLAKSAERLYLLSDVYKGIADVNSHLFAEETLSLMYQEGVDVASYEAISSLFDRLSTCVENGRTNYIDSLMQKADLKRLTPELMVGILRFTSIVRDKLTSRALYFSKVREELTYRRIDADDVLHGIPVE